jgi:NADPH:quinone reductase-like Zn-dependent oxidoreductase
MHAAVVSSFGTPPRYQEFPTPVPDGPHEVLVDVLAAGLHPRVRSQADGSHYTSSDELPLVPGIDGVGRAPDGSLRYFVLPDTTMGSMAEQTVVDLRRSIVLPPDTDPVLIAAAMNPAMSSWVALRRRIAFEPGQSVRILGVTGNAGRLAVQIVKHLGAKEVTNDGTDVDIVIDYVWGQPAADAMRDLITNRPDRGKPLTWIQIGSVAGPTAAIPSAALRAARMQIVGSGQGSVPTGDILEELPALADAIIKGTFEIDARPVPLAEVEAAWRTTRSKERLVLTAMG